MVATMLNEDFVKLLSSTAVTASTSADDPDLNAVVVGTTRIEWDGPGTDNVMAAVSTDGLVSGQCIYECDGDLPLLKFALDQSQLLITVAKNVARIVKKTDKEAEATVELSIVEGGAFLLVRTLTDGDSSPNDSKHYVPLQDVTTFPLTTTLADLRDKGNSMVFDQTGGELPSGAMQAFSGSALDTLNKIAGVFKEPVELYTLGHPAAKVNFTCGGHFRGVISAHVYSADVDVDSPMVEVAHELDDPDAA